MTFPHSADVEVEEETLWVNAEVVETDAPLVRDMSIRTVPPYQSSAEELETWTVLLKSLKATRNEPKRDKEEPRPLRVVEDYQLTLSPKKYRTAALAMGWEIRQLAILVWHPPVYQENDGKVRKDGSQVMAGDMTTPAKEKSHLTLEAKHPKAQLGFEGHWIDGQFVEAFLHDPIGLLDTLEFEYKPIKPPTNEKGNQKLQELALEAAERRAAHWNAEYNDGESWVVHTKLVSTGAEFNEWIDEWIDKLAPDAKRLTVNRKPKGERVTDDELLGGAEWTTAG